MSDLSAIQSAQQPPSGDKGASLYSPSLQAQFLGEMAGPKAGDSGLSKAMGDTLTAAQQASAQLLDRNATVSSPEQQQALQARNNEDTVKAGFISGEKVMNVSEAKSNDTKFDPAAHYADLAQQAEDNTFGKVITDKDKKAA